MRSFSGELNVPEDCPGSRLALYDPAFTGDPHAVYTRLQRAGRRVVPVELAAGVPAWMVVDYDLAMRVLRDPVRFPRDPRRWQQTVPPDSPVLAMLGYRPNALFADGDEHLRLRAAITTSLAQVPVPWARECVARVAGELIAEFAPRGTADLLAEYARPLTIRVLTRMLGCPAELGERILATMTRIFTATTAEAQPANVALLHAVHELCEYKRETPGRDVTSWLLASAGPDEVGETVQQVALLFAAGTTPQQNLITGAITRLLLADDDPVGDNLATGRMPVLSAIDDVLWSDPPMPVFSAHHPRETVWLDGVRIPHDEPVVISYAAANRQQNCTPLMRAGNRAHLGFSAGPHTCPARSLGRLIATVAIETLLDTLPEVTLAIPPRDLRWKPSPFSRELVTLPVRF